MDWLVSNWWWLIPLMVTAPLFLCLVAIVVVISIGSLYITSYIRLTDRPPSKDVIEKAHAAARLVAEEFSGAAPKKELREGLEFEFPSDDRVQSLSVHEPSRKPGLVISIRSLTMVVMALPTRTTRGSLPKLQILMEQRLLEELDGLPILSAERVYSGADIREDIVKGQPPANNRFRIR